MHAHLLIIPLNPFQLLPHLQLLIDLLPNPHLARAHAHAQEVSIPIDAEGVVVQVKALDAIFFQHSNVLLFACLGGFEAVIVVGGGVFSLFWVRFVLKEGEFFLHLEVF